MVKEETDCGVHRICVESFFWDVEGYVVDYECDACMGGVWSQERISDTQVFGCIVGHHELGLLDSIDS